MSILAKLLVGISMVGVLLLGTTQTAMAWKSCKACKNACNASCFGNDDCKKSCKLSCIKTSGCPKQ